MPKSYQWGGWPLIFFVSALHFDIGASSKIDDVLTEDGGLLHVVPLAVHLDHSYFMNFIVGPLLHAWEWKLGVVVVVA